MTHIPSATRTLENHVNMSSGLSGLASMPRIPKPIEGLAGRLVRLRDDLLQILRSRRLGLQHGNGLTACSSHVWLSYDLSLSHTSTSLA